MIYYYAVGTIRIDDDRLPNEATAEKDEKGEKDSFHRLLYFKNFRKVGEKLG
jgi:hypothetical protein